jgi:myo-inositol-1-phosphate synthase
VTAKFLTTGSRFAPWTKEAGMYPFYKDFDHKICINYYPPRGENKEGWDNLDIFGGLGHPMPIKIDFLCRDSIPAPVVLDLVLFMDLGPALSPEGPQRHSGMAVVLLQESHARGRALSATRSVHSVDEA